MNKSDEIKKLLASFFKQVSAEQLEQARAVTGLGYLPRGSLQHLFDDQRFSLEDLVTLLLADSMVRQEELKIKSERIAELEALCSQQHRAIDQIANQSIRLRALIAKIDPEQDALSSFDILKNIASHVDKEQL